MMSKLKKSYEQATTSEHRETLIKHGVRAVLNEELKEKWQQTLEEKYQISKEVQEIPTQVIKINYYKILAIAASFALFAFLGRTFFKTTVDSIQLAETYLENQLIQHPGLKKGIALEEQEVRLAAIQSFETKNYKESIDLFSQLGKRNSEDKFYLSVALIYTQQYESAIELLSGLAKANTLYDQEVRWYLSIAYILNDQPTLAKGVLLKIIESDWNYDNAQSLLMTLNK